MANILQPAGGYTECGKQMVQGTKSVKYGLISGLESVEDLLEKHEKRLNSKDET